MLISMNLLSLTMSDGSDESIEGRRRALQHAEERDRQRCRQRVSMGYSKYFTHAASNIRSVFGNSIQVEGYSNVPKSVPNKANRPVPNSWAIIN